jgi:hypothetical protein
MSPCPESEKENDRCTATEALKAILKLDYKVSSEDIAPVSPATERRSHETELVSLIKQTPVRLSRLRQIWLERNKPQWMTDPPILYRTMGEMAWKIGEPFFA